MSEKSPAEKAEILGRRLRLVLLLNLVYASLPLLWWEQLSQFLMDPVRWATWTSLGPNPGILEYPYAMLWGLPLAGFAIGWLLQLGGSRRTALWIESFPPLYLTTLLASFYIIPNIMF